jgi:hypothetical protein
MLRTEWNTPMIPMMLGCGRDTSLRDMSLSEALSDPLIRAVMTADRVDPDRLAWELRETARNLQRTNLNVA